MHLNTLRSNSFGSWVSGGVLSMLSLCLLCCSRTISTTPNKQDRPSHRHVRLHNCNSSQLKQQTYNKRQDIKVPQNRMCPSLQPLTNTHRHTWGLDFLFPFIFDMIRWNEWQITRHVVGDPYSDDVPKAAHQWSRPFLCWPDLADLITVNLYTGRPVLAENEIGLFPHL